MNIYDYLKLDHKAVSKLFIQFKNCNFVERRKQIMAMIAIELLVHAHAEQETFYKELKQYDVSKEGAEHGQEEHTEIEDQIKAILNAKRFDSAWVKKVQNLQKTVDHHVREEERPIFRKAKKVLSDEDAYRLKEQMHYLKHKIRPVIEKEVDSFLQEEKEKPKKTAKSVKVPHKVVKHENRRVRLH